MMRTTILTLALASAALMLAVACSDSGGSGGGDGGGTAGTGGGSPGQGGSGGSGGTTGGNGVTPCGTFAGAPKSCIAGQYCSDETLSICNNGCLSNTNCASNQECVKASGNTGDCQNKTTKSCTAFNAKCKACQPSATDAQCQQLCDQVSAECVNCVANANCNDTSCNTLCGM